MERTNDPAARLTQEVRERPLRRLHHEEDGLATAEYGIVMLAAVAFAGLLTAVLTSDTVRGWLETLVQQALNG